MNNQIERSLFNYIMIGGGFVASVSMFGYLFTGMYIDAIYGFIALLVIAFLLITMRTQFISYDSATRTAMITLMLIVLMGYITSSTLEDGIIYIIIPTIIVPILRPYKEARLSIGMYYLLFFIINYFEIAAYNISISIYVQLLAIHLLLFTIITHYIDRNSAMQSKMNTLNVALHKEATTDMLTGTMNRRAYNTMIKKRIEQFNRDYQQFALALFDIDHFKNINDTFGHDVGDKALCDMSKYVINNLREGDVIARFGGEEFIVYLHNCDLESAYKVMEKLRVGVHENCSCEYDMSISVGVTVIHAGDTEASLIKRADNAMYMAKDAGRNMTCKA